MASESEQRRILLGVPLTASVVDLVLVALVLTTFVGLAVLSWLERSA